MIHEFKIDPAWFMLLNRIEIYRWLLIVNYLNSQSRILEYFQVYWSVVLVYSLLIPRTRL